MKRKKKLRPLQKQLVHLLLIFVICVLSIIVWSISDYIKLQNKNLENTLELYAGHLAQTARQSYTSYENIAYSDGDAVREIELPSLLIIAISARYEFSFDVLLSKL